MTDSDDKDPRPPHLPTLQLGSTQGNPLFERAVAALGFDDGTTRWMLVSVLGTIGSKPDNLTPEDLGVLLPEVDRRLRKLVLAEQADRAMARLYEALMSWPASG